MALNDIKLSGLIIGEWYGDCILANLQPDASAGASGPVAPASAKAVLSPIGKAAASVPAVPAPVKSLGSNRRHITLLVHSPGSSFLSDSQLIFLTRILEACRMTIGDVAIVNQAAAPVSMSELKQQLHPKTVLLFGVEPAAIRLPINFPHFRAQNYDDCDFLSVPALDKLVTNTEESKLLKSKLWVCLKTIFDV